MVVSSLLFSIRFGVVCNSLFVQAGSSLCREARRQAEVKPLFRGTDSKRIQVSMKEG